MDINTLKRHNFVKSSESLQISSAFCTKAVERLKAGPEVIPSVIKKGAKYRDTSFTGPDMVYWEGDTLTTPDYTDEKNSISKEAYIFKDWTTFLPSNTDLFYANGSISFNQINQGGIGDCYFMSSASALAEWPDRVRNVFLTQKKNNAGIFGVRFFIRGKPYHISVDDNTMFYNNKP